MRTYRFLLFLNTFIFTFAVLSILFLPDLRNFEISIYDAGRIFWILAILNLSLNVFILMMVKEKIGKLFLLSILYQVLFVKILIVSFWAIRGYAGVFYRGDQATYIGLAKDIILWGTFFDNFYPFISILLSSISLVSSLKVEEVAKILPPFFQFLFFIWLVLLSKKVFANDKVALTCVAFSVPFIFNWFPITIYPHMNSAYFLPAVIYMLYLPQVREVKISLMLLLSVFIFWHPFTAVTILSFIALLSLQNRKYLTIFGIYITLCITWFLYNLHLAKTLEILITQITSEFKINTKDIAEIYVQKLGIFNSFRVVSMMVFDDIIFYAISIVGLYYYIKNNRVGKKSKNLDLAPMFFLWLISSLLIAFLFFGVRGHVPDRLINLNWSLIFAPIIAGYVFSNFGDRKRKLIVLFVFISIISSIFTLYPSPLTQRSNECHLISEIEGANWLILNTNNTGTKFAYILTPIGRYSDLIYGTKNEERGRYHIGYLRGESYSVPSHFNLSEYDRNFLGERIFILTKYEVVSYSTVWERVDRFNLNDFRLLMIDFASNYIYTNNNFYVYLVDFQKFNQR